jgi:hypothetical protein
MRPVLRSKITERPVYSGRKSRKGFVLRSFSCVKRSWDFLHFFRNSDRQAEYLPSTSLAGTFHRRRSRLLKTGLFRAGKGAENTKEKSRQCFMSEEECAEVYAL